MLRSLLTVPVLLVVGAMPASGQDTTAIPLPPESRAAGGWDTPRVLELVARARDRRREPVADSSLRTYRADAGGFIYFFVDREDGSEPVLLRADQVALELYWGRPDRVKQVIRGMRSEEQLPIRNFSYYLDRYTVIQNGFGDEIRVGEGRDVRDVPHPLAPRAESLYEYRLADSTTIRLPGRPSPLRVYQIEARPRDFGLPAIVGTLWVERQRGDLVRLAFTFTPSAYLDPRNERVEVMIENALWEGKWWLPREQRLLVRRELPELDLDVGTVIRASIRVTDYELNPTLPTGFFNGQRVIMAAGPRGLQNYDFGRGLYDGFEDVGLAPGADPGTLDDVDVDAIAGEIFRRRYLRGIPRVRFWTPDASSVVRYDRAEGLVTGAGLSMGVGRSQLFGYGAWAWGRDEPIVALGWRPPATGDRRVRAEVYYNRPRDLGLRPAAAGLLSSAAAVALGDDYRDLFFAGGAEASVAVPALGGYFALLARAEYQTPAATAATAAPLDDDALFRPALRVTEGGGLSGTGLFRRTGSGPFGSRSDLEVELEVGNFGDELFGRLVASRTDVWRSDDLRRRFATGATIGVLQTKEPFMQPFLVGGRGTLPGHPFRAYFGDIAWLADAALSYDAVPRWLRLRASAAIGGTHNSVLAPTPGAWSALATPDGPLTSLALGVATIDGVLRLDYAWGFGGLGRGWDRGTLILSIDPSLWPFM